MPRKRPTESSWDSDEELLGDTSSVSAFSSKKGGDDEIDEDALLGFSDEGIQEYSEGAEYSFTTSEIDIGLDSSAGLDVTAESQELDYEDVPEEAAEEFVLEENTDIDTLMVDEQPNATTCALQSTEPSEMAEEDSDDESNKRDRGRFQTERKTTNIKSSSKASSIPDSLEITKEMQAEIDTFEKQKGKFNFRGRGRQPQRFQNQNARGRGQMRGANMQPRMQGPGSRLMGPRSAGPNRLRSPQGFQRPMGQPMRQNSSPGMPRPLMFNHRPRGPNQVMNRGPVPRFPREMVRPTNHGPRPDNTPRQPIPQPYMSSQPMPMQPMYTDQSNYSQPAYSQTVHTQPQPVHSQPHIMQSQPAGSTIHVNPKFQGGLPSSVQQSSQHALLPHSVPQPVYSQHQPIQSYQESQQAWAPQHHHGQPVSMHSSTHGGYPQPQQMYPPQPVPLLPDHQNRPGILGANPSALMPPPDHQRQPDHSNMNMQNPHHIQPRPLLQTQQHHPNQQHQHVRHMGPPHTSNQHGPRNPHPGPPHQVRPQRPVANQNIRGPRPANQMSGNVRQMRPPGGQEFKPRNPQANQRFKTPHPVGQKPSQGWNPTPDQLAAPVKTEEDPDKERKLKEMEEKKRLRAERFKMNTPVQVNAGSPSNKKVIATKRPSGEDPAEDEISPAKTVRIETLATMKTDSSSVNSEDALKKALEEQKKRRELIMKIKEAKRQALAEQKRKTLAQKLSKEGKSTVEDNQPMEIQQINQQQAQNQQFTTQNRGRGRGQKLNRGRGQGHVNMGGHGQGQPISVLGQSQPNLIQIPVDGDQIRGHGFNEGQGQSRGQGPTRGRGHGPTRGVIMNRGRGRGVQSVPNVVQLQQVEIQDSAMYDNGVNRTLNEPSNNRTVLSSSATRQVIGMNPRGAATQVVARGRTVIDKSEESPAPRRIVVNSLESTQSSTVLIKDLPAKVDLGKVNKKCAQHGNIKSFNYKVDAKQIVVQYNSPAEAAAFLKKNPKFMIDMGYLTASSIPDGSM